jgi:hypothetical protein
MSSPRTCPAGSSVAANGIWRLLNAEANDTMGDGGHVGHFAGSVRGQDVPQQILPQVAGRERHYSPIRTVPCRRFSKSKRPMMARLEMGEVLLPTRMSNVFLRFHQSIIARIERTSAALRKPGKAWL